MSICPDCLQCADCGAWYACTSEPTAIIPCPHGTRACWDCVMDACPECRADDHANNGQHHPLNGDNT